jgi:wobble nucleotide-excising tRNase
VIVLSHDPSFLKQISDLTPAGDVKVLQFFRVGTSSSKIVECDIADLTQGDYFDNYSTLFKFCYENEGKPKLVVRAIRPLLEAYFRMKQPRAFKPDEWLGDMIKKIRDAKSESPLSDAQALLGELEAINDYSKQYHHDKDGENEGVLIDEGELQAFVNQTLALVGGF